MEAEIVHDTLDTLVATLARRLGRPALLEDRTEQLLAYSEHNDACDAVRLATIIHRRADPAVIDWLRQLRVPQARTALRTPANPGLGMLPRVCVPVRHDGILMGYLWFIDPDGDMANSDIAIAVQAADAAGVALYRAEVLGASALFAEDIEELLTGTSRGSTELHSVFPADVPVVAVVVQALSGSSEHRVDTELVIGRVLLKSAQHFPARHELRCLRRGHGVLLLQVSADPRTDLDEIAEVVDGETHAAMSQLGFVAGIGQPQRELSQAGLSYQQAREAAEVAEHSPEFGSMVRWSQIGIHQAISILVETTSHGFAPHLGLQRMLEQPSLRPLIETLETYLDVAGNAQVAAERLNLHRTSLYYRLRRIELLADTDLKNGIERLALHLTLKVRRADAIRRGQHGRLDTDDGSQADRR